MARSLNTKYLKYEVSSAGCLVPCAVGNFIFVIFFFKAALEATSD